MFSVQFFGSYASVGKWQNGSPHLQLVFGRHLHIAARFQLTVFHMIFRHRHKSG